MGGFCGSGLIEMAGFRWMGDMELIRAEMHAATEGKRRIELAVDRMVLAKRRWRGVAKDGREFGFDLEHPVHDGAIFFEEDAAVYVVAQRAETVLEISLGDASHAARLGWMIGNLHFAIEVHHGTVRTQDDPAVRQLLEREHIAFAVEQRVFHPLRAVSSHHHHEH
jgi:urease accessory protein